MLSLLNRNWACQEKNEGAKVCLSREQKEGNLITSLSNGQMDFEVAKEKGEQKKPKPKTEVEPKKEDGLGELKSVVFDLETIGDPEAIDTLPPVEPNANLKDPVKIHANIAEKEQKQREEMGVDPTLNLICCASFLDLATKELSSILLNPDTLDEKELLCRVWERLYHYDRFITFNGRAFDEPVLRFHSMRWRVPMAVNMERRRYVSGNHVDVRMLLTNWDSYKPGKLSFFTKRLLGKDAKSDMDGSMVQHYWDCGEYIKIGLYCESDVALTAELYERIKGWY
jgi:predicted PolB exonuclease-like 3'-5' exonuclease